MTCVQPQSPALPERRQEQHAFHPRESFADAPRAGVYFGISSGTAYYTRDAGENWKILAENLPPIYSVTVAQA